MSLRRGFKAEAERLAKDIWDAMGLSHSDRMDAVELAKHVGCIVRPADTLVSIARLEGLRRVQDDAFFACTFELPSGRRAIVFNPLTSDTRRNSDVAHEVAHIILEHRLSRLERLGNVAFLSCDKTARRRGSMAFRVPPPSTVRSDPRLKEAKGTQNDRKDPGVEQ